MYFMMPALRFFSIFFSFGKAGGRQILDCQGIGAADASFRLGTMTLSPSGFCNIGVNFFPRLFPHLLFAGEANLTNL
jgi:hypothetical protein